MNVSYLIGLKALKSFLQGQDGLAFFRSKLSPVLFKGAEEQAAFGFVQDHFRKFRVLPQAETAVAAFPLFAEVEAPEPPDYYVAQLEKRYEYDRLNQLATSIQETLTANKNATAESKQLVVSAIHELTQQSYRRQLLDMGSEGGSLLMTAYGDKLKDKDSLAIFGWEYMDDLTNGVGGGEVVSYVGRPALGKSWFMVYGANKNWVHQKTNVLFASMEMNTLSIAQRLGAIYSKVGVKGIREAQLSTPMFKRFQNSLKAMEKETGKLYILDGNLMANIEELYFLAYQLKCSAIYIDGAYLVRSTNPRLGRYEKVAENCEYMKRISGEMNLATFASWQFNRDAQKKNIKKGQKVGLEDIGYSDAIGQLSSIVLGLNQEDGVETLMRRHIDVMKGRNGEVGGFDVNWLFDVMDFDQVKVNPAKALEFV